MRRILPALGVFLLLAIPAQLFAKAKTDKITITGAGLKVPIEITDPNIVSSFQVWSGAGTSADAQPRSFIVDWSKGQAAEPPKGLPRYEVSFWAKLSEERVVYVVQYEYDPATNTGYVYLPGPGEKWYRLDCSSICRDVEGEWFHAWSEWDKVAGPLLADHAGR